MNRLLSAAALLLTTALAAATPAFGEDKPKGDLGKIQGKWTGKAGPGKAIELTVTFDGNDVKVAVVTPGGENIDLKGEVKLDDQAKPHKTMDWVKFTFPNGTAMPDRPGIYEFEDADTLKVCAAGLDGERPTSFKEPQGDENPGEFVLKREPKAKDADKCEGPKDAPAVAPAIKGDLAKFQGAWTAKVGPEKNIPVVVTIKNSEVTLKLVLPDGQDYQTTGAIKVDDQAKPHKTIDWVKFTNANGEATPENLGVYEFADADTLKVCNGGPGNERPTEFKAGEGGPPQLITLKREKAK